MKRSIVAFLAATFVLTPAADEYHTLVNNGAWCWFQDPRAVRSGDNTYVSYVTSGGDVRISAFNHTTRQVSHATLHGGLQVDDHNSGGIQVLPDGRLMTFYSKHGDSTGLRYRISTTVGDITSWGPEQTVTGSASSGSVTYSNPVMLSNESNRIYTFYRSGNRDPHVSWTDDEGATWSGPIQYINNLSADYPYVQVASNGGSKIHIVWTDTHPVFDNKNVNYMYYEDKGSGGAFYKADDTLIRTMAAVAAGSPITPGKADVVYTAAGSDKSWNWDIAPNADNRPVILHTNLSAGGGQHDYHYATWNGSAWTSTQFADAGGSIDPDDEIYYSGGLALDFNDPSTVYVSRQVPATETWTVEKWTTSDGGSTWSNKALTDSPASKNIRPVAVHGAIPGDEVQVVWMQGLYGSYTSYSTTLVGWPMTDELGDPSPGGGSEDFISH